MEYWIISIVFICSACISIIGYKGLLKKQFFSFLKKRNTDTERFASQSKPIFGGVVFYISFLIASVASLFFADLSTTTPYYMGAVIVSVSLAFFMGLLDDITHSSPLYKFLTQVACSIILIASGIYIHLFDNNIYNYILSIVWITGIMNSINMLDNMDGITASISAVIILTIIALILHFQQAITFDIIVLTSVIASITIYLYWNWHPSKIYMGDNGSQFLGILLAIYSTQYIWDSPTPVGSSHIREFMLIGLVFLIPLTDTFVVSVNRLLAGKSPFVGDRYHTTHNLVYMGLSIRQTAILLLSIALLSCAAAWYCITHYTTALAYWVSIISVSIAIAVPIVFFILSRIVKRKNV